MTAPLVISRRFNGPPDSANGGYTCGLVAALLGGGPAEVTLRSPPPLDRELDVRREGDAIVVRDGETLVAEGRRAPLELEPLPAVGLDEARAAVRAGLERWTGRHPFRSCVVCGPDRAAGDGFRIFPGELPGRGELYAAVWTPGPGLADDGGELPEECVWAALDCPTSAPVANFGEGPPLVLGRLAARIDARVRVSSPHVVLSWPLERDGRKRHSAAALFSPEGEPIAVSRALWIELRGRQEPQKAF